jgi:hypothetical protein
LRTLTAPETTLLAAAGKRLAYKVEIQNHLGTWQDFTTLSGIDWVVSIVGSEGIDDPIQTLTLELRRDHGGLSLSPFRGDSSLNTGGTAVDVGRGIRVSTAYATFDTAPVAGDFRFVHVGTIDLLDFSGINIQVQSRMAVGAKLVDRWVRTETEYGTVGGRRLDLVIQDIISAWASGITLEVPTLPAYNVTSYMQQSTTVWDAIRTLAGLIGWDIRILWNSTAGEFRPTLIQPDRTKTVPDYTFAPPFIYNVTQLSIDRTWIRNTIDVWYLDTNGVRLSVGGNDTASIARFDEQWALIIRGTGSPIDTSGEATALLNAALADLAWPIADQVVEVPYFWPLEIGDLYRFSANGIHYNGNQDLAATAHRWEIRKGKARSYITVRGKPAGFYRTWLNEFELGGNVGGRAPVLKFSTLTHSGSTGTATVTAEDPDLLLTALEFATKVGTGAYSAFASTWDSATGTVGGSPTLLRTESVFVGARGSYIQVRPTYKIDGTTYQPTMEYYFDPDYIAEVLGFSVDFTAANLVKITDLSCDEDTVVAYANITTDGSTPADPTSGSHDISLFGSPPTGTMTSSITCDPGDTAKIKIRGANSGGTLGPIRQGERLNGAGVVNTAVITLAVLSGGSTGSPTGPVSGTLTLAYSVDAPSGWTVEADLYADGQPHLAPWMSATTTLSDTSGTARSRSGYRDTSLGLQVNYAALLLVKDGGGNVKAAMWTNTYPEYQDILI